MTAADVDVCCVRGVMVMFTGEWSAGATKAHGYSDRDVADAPRLEEIWPHIVEFCGADILVAHNGYMFDFPILRRMAAKLPRGTDFSTYDTLPLARTLHATSRKLEHLAKRYGIHGGRTHRAHDRVTV